jgi:hypothetical protein
MKQLLTAVVGHAVSIESWAFLHSHDYQRFQERYNYSI